MLEQYAKMILRARVYDLARETPMDPARTLSRKLGNEVLLKREDLQPVFSFKLRGACNKMVNLPREARERGVIAASAGNHAQGVALSARHLGLDALIVMPETTPPIKVDAVRALGAGIALHGNTYDDALQRAFELAQQQGRTFIHPYDDPEVIAGQGTVAMEILHTHATDLHAIFVPVGGGGLIAGVAAYTKYLCPEIKVIGVEPDDAPTLHAALAAQQRVVLDQVGIFVDGVAVKQIGEEPFRIAREYVDEVILVSTDEVCAAIKDIFDDTRSIAEPAGALAVAGLKRYVAREQLSGKRLVAIESGANINFDRLRHVAERAALGEQREALFAVTIPERPGAFRAFCETLGTRAITEFNYRYSDDHEAHVFVGVQVGRRDERGQVRELLEHAGYGVVDLTDNEMAKLHVRYMVGGRASVAGERLLRFEFPERPGALLQFLNRIGGKWNISMFHYRNHGADYGRVLAGIQVPPGDEYSFRRFLDQLDYPSCEETGNPSFNLFLR